MAPVYVAGTSGKLPCFRSLLQSFSSYMQRARTGRGDYDHMPNWCMAGKRKAWLRRASRGRKRSKLKYATMNYITNKVHKPKALDIQHTIGAQVILDDIHLSQGGREASIHPKT
eukprot:5156289-Pleurochrysis_carterae.AAC.1